MTSYARRRPDGSWEELAGAVTLSIDGGTYRYPSSALASMEAGVLAANGIMAIAEAGPAPAGMQILGQAIADLAGVPARVWQAVPFDLAELKAALVAEVNARCAAFRRRFVTDITGQELTYWRKEQEARAIKAGGAVKPGGYIAVEAAQKGITPEALADIVVGLADAWDPLNIAVEALRTATGDAIDRAADHDAARAAAAAADFDALLPPA